MKVSILQENLAQGLGIVSRAVSPRSTLPVLANVLVATDNGRLRLSATDLELGITCWIGAKRRWKVRPPSRREPLLSWSGHFRRIQSKWA